MLTTVNTVFCVHVRHISLAFVIVLDCDMFVVNIIIMLASIRHVEGALNEFEPQVVVYNAGTDVLEGDPLGCLSITAQVRVSLSICAHRISLPGLWHNNEVPLTRKHIILLFEDNIIAIMWNYAYFN